ncbi:MAG: alpha/beta hydrolase [Verrucomicrobiota bacterium]
MKRDHQMIGTNTINPRQRAGRILWRWAKRLALSLLTLAVLAALGAATYQAAATRKLERNHPAPGKLFDVGGHRLHLHSQGSGSPAVILDAGLSGASYDWETVAAGIAQFTQVCTYDRAGYGWSDPGPQPRTSQQAVEELRTLLQKADVKPPVLLLGHSWAGLNARLYASKYPDEISGLVLVDAVNTDLLPDTEPLGQVSKLFRFLNLTACLGTPRFTVRRIINAPANDPSALEFRRAMLSRTKSAQAIYDELTGESNWLSVRSALKPLGEKPVVVISQLIEEADCVGEAGAGNLQWEQGQKALLGISKNCRRIIAKTKGHNIQFNEPAVIVDSVHELVKAVRAEAGGSKLIPPPSTR